MNTVRDEQAMRRTLEQIICLPTATMPEKACRVLGEIEHEISGLTVIDPDTAEATRVLCLFEELDEALAVKEEFVCA